MSVTYIPELTGFPPSRITWAITDKGKPDQSQGRKATGPRFLRDAFCYATKDSKIAGLQRLIGSTGDFP